MPSYTDCSTTKNHRFWAARPSAATSTTWVPDGKQRSGRPTVVLTWFFSAAFTRKQVGPSFPSRPHASAMWEHCKKCGVKINLLILRAVPTLAVRRPVVKQGGAIKNRMFSLPSKINRVSPGGAAAAPRNLRLFSVFPSPTDRRWAERPHSLTLWVCSSRFHGWLAGSLSLAPCLLPHPSHSS